MPAQGRYAGAATAFLIALLVILTVAELFVPSRFETALGDVLRDSGLLIVAAFAGASLPRRDQHPERVSIILAVLSVAAFGLDGLFLASFMWAMAIFNLGSFAAQGTRGRLLMLGGIVVPTVVALFWGRIPALIAAALAMAITAAAVARRDRRRYVLSLAERAYIAEERSELLANSARDAERTRIANDLHDSVGQTLAIIAANAAGAARAFDRDPAVAKSSLEAISKTAREAAQDLRNTVFELRTAGGPVQAASLFELADRLRSVGRPVDLVVNGDRDSIPEPALYVLRLVAREAFTNALKYGERSKPVVVRLDIGTSDVRLEVTNQIAREPLVARGGGHGLTSMRERIEAAGGTLDVRSSGDQFSLVGLIAWQVE